LAPAASRATAVGILGTLLQLAWGAGSLLAGPLITSRGYQYVFTLAAGIYLLAVPASNLLFHIATSPLPPRRQAPAVQWERLYQPVAALPLMRYLPGVPDDPGERGRWLVAGALG
ncbi:MAG: hypothetical protein HY335_10515, partial [Deinococcus sp.]|nr:hypothetical protein [Deinococcus sp.]